jgi:hypothetical protein
MNKQLNSTAQSPLCPVKYRIAPYMHSELKFHVYASHPELGLELANTVHDTLLACSYIPSAGQFQEQWQVSDVWVGRQHEVATFTQKQPVRYVTFQHVKLGDALLTFRVGCTSALTGLDLGRAISDLLIGTGYRPTILTLSKPIAVSMFTTTTGFEPLIIR